MTPTERAELALFGTARGEHTSNLERDLYAISQATLVRTIEAAEQDVLSRPAQRMPTEINQHIAWLKQYIGGMNDMNWKDMQLRAERQLETLCALSSTPSVPAQSVLDGETIQTLLDLLNPLHGSLDKQNYDENVRADFNLPDDYEHDCIVTRRQESDLTQAVLILENRSSTLTSTECGEGK